MNLDEQTMEIEPQPTWKPLERLATSKSEFASDYFNQHAESGKWKQALQEAHVLVVGAGGLGCELIKNLALSGVKKIHIIDMDTIELTNLNRQFLFRPKDINRFKSEVAAEFIQNRIKSCQVTYSVKKIQEETDEFYKKFDVIIGGLDNDGARRWLNQLVHRLVVTADAPGTGFYDKNGEINFDQDGFAIVPQENKVPIYIDGGIEKLSGQVRAFIPYHTSCYACLGHDDHKEQKTQFCTIASKPRIPEHCVVIVIESDDAGYWKRTFDGRNYDTDSSEDIKWIYEKAKEVAEANSIEGLTFEVTLGVCKNIMPNIASTNAIIASYCVTETLKAIGKYAPLLQDGWLYGGGQTNGVSASIDNGTEGKRERNLGGEVTCGICGNAPRLLTQFKRDSKFGDFMDWLWDNPLPLPVVKKGEPLPLLEKLMLQSPIVYSGGKVLYNPAKKEASDLLLSKTFQELIDEGTYKENKMIFISDPQILYDKYSVTVTRAGQNVAISQGCPLPFVIHFSE